MNLFEELKRRNVVRVVAAYVVLSWLLLQIGDVVFDFMDVPDWAGRLLIAFLAIGFVPAVIFSWVYELTPEGVKRESEVDRSASITSHTGRKLNLITIGMAMLAVATIILDRWILPEPTGAPAETSAKAAAESAVAEATAAQAANDASIAVLPFVPLSEDKEDEFFADGLSEELLNVLAQIDALKVAGRTSSFSFKGRNEDLRIIGERLGVAHILEGSVRRQGDQVRITAQLIQVDDGFHLWSETYDRTLDDIFAIQDDIAQSVVDALRVTLLGEAEPIRIVSNRDVDPRIHARYLAARARQNQRTLSDLRVARDMFEAITVDAPDFEPGWSGLATSTLLLLSNHADLPADQAIESAGVAIRRALALNPESAEAWSAKGYLHMQAHTQRFDSGELELSVEALDRAVDLNPQFGQALYWKGIAHESLNELEAANAMYRRALAIDPLARVPAARLPTSLAKIGRLDEAREAAQYLVRAFPDYSLAYFNLALWAEAAGMPAAGLLYWEKAASLNSEDGRSLMFAARAAIALNDLDRARGLLEAVQSPQELVREAHRVRQRIDGKVDALIEAEMAATGTASDQFALAGALIQVERWADGLAELEREVPTFFQDEPSVPLFLSGLAALTVVALEAQGYSDMADRLGQAAWATVEPLRTQIRAPIERYLRLMVLAAIGDPEKLADELDEGIEFGQPRLADFDGWSIRKDVRFRRVLQDPRIEERVARMEALAAEALARLEAGEVELLKP